MISVRISYAVTGDQCLGFPMVSHMDWRETRVGDISYMCKCHGLESTGNSSVDLSIILLFSQVHDKYLNLLGYLITCLEPNGLNGKGLYRVVLVRNKKELVNRTDRQAAAAIELNSIKGRQ